MGLGRYLTSRRFVKNNSDINYDKIICWEYPNFVYEVLRKFDEHNFIQKKNMHPIQFLKLLDFNLITSFILIKK